MAKRKGAPRKPVGKRKINYLRVRVTDTLDQAIRKAAEARQISVSAWATQALVNAVRADGVAV